MADETRDRTLPGEVQALLGAGTSYEGKLAFDGRVRIDGRFKGDVSSRGVLVIGGDADVEGTFNVGALIVRGGKCDPVEGEGRGRNVVVEFETYETALACYHSPEYQAAAKIRRANSIGEIVIVEGAA